MDRGYDTSISRRQWQIGLFAFALTVIVGAALAAALLAGAANPPRAARLVLNLNSAESLVPHGHMGDLWLTTIQSELKPPFTLEMEAENHGAPNSKWGMWIWNHDASGTITSYPLMIDNQGYVFTDEDNKQQQYQFSHIQRVDNQLTLNVSADGCATFRINNEVFRTVQFPPDSLSDVDLADLNDPQLNWKAIKIYTG